MVSSNISRVIAVAVGLGFFALMPARALAHCDGLDGPVVKAAQRALETRNAALVLIWVQEKDDGSHHRTCGGREAQAGSRWRIHK